jgi:hypothetical protein
VNRGVLQERLKLQNELLKRDLWAIDVPMVKEAKLVEQEAVQKAHEPSDKG